MRRTHSANTLTAAEAVTLLRRLEPRSGITLRKFRYIAQLLGMTTAGRGATRMYDRVELTLIRLCLRLEGETSLWLARAAVLYLEPSLRFVFENRPLGAAVLLHGNRAVFTTIGQVERKGLPGTVILLRDVWDGLAQGIRDIRKRQPDVWMWTPVPAAQAVARVREIVEEKSTGKPM